MTTYISLLRGINVSGQKKIRMAKLRDMYASLTFANVKTYLQSGNAIFDTSESDADALGKRIEAEIERVFGFSVPVLMRGVDDFHRIVASNPFVNERQVDTIGLYVTFLYNTPSTSQWAQLVVPDGDSSEFVIARQEIYVYCPSGYGRTKFSNNFIERKLGMATTTRNWKTVNALYKTGIER